MTFRKQILALGVSENGLVAQFLGLTLGGRERTNLAPCVLMIG